MSYTDANGALHVSVAEESDPNVDLPAFFKLDDPYPDPKYFPGENPVAVDPKIQQLLEQNSDLADFAFAATKMLSAFPTAQPGGPFEALAQEMRTKVNALNPSKFVFK